MDTTPPPPGDQPQNPQQLPPPPPPPPPPVPGVMSVPPGWKYITAFISVMGTLTAVWRALSCVLAIGLLAYVALHR